MTASDLPPPSPPPVLRAVSTAELPALLTAGWRDFRAAPGIGLFFGGVYALGGLAMYVIMARWGAPWMIIPIAIGFPLIGPFVAAGCYEVSRRLASGIPIIWPQILHFMASQRRREFSWMAFIVLFIFWIWMYQVRLLVALMLEMRDLDSLGGFLSTVLTTADGLIFLAVGSAVGAVLAFVLYASTVIAMPLLIEREHDIVTAIATSWRAVLSNPAPMLGWGVMVAGITVLAMLPLFLGLFIALPVLGHATWHLYRRVVEPIGAQALT